MGTTKAFAEWAVKTRYDDIPQEAIEIAKGLVLDCMGGAVAGAYERVTQMVTKFVTDSGGVPECGVLGQGFKTSLTNAVLVNATSDHSQELEAMGHYTGSNPFYNIPVALAMAERYKLSGKEVLEGIIVGFEVQGRMGRYLSGWGRGFSGLTLYGTMGSVVTASKMLKLTVDQTRMAIGLAIGSSGSQRNAGSMGHVLEAGIGCRNGATAALLAKEGATADPDLIEGKGGFVDQFVADEYDLEAATAGLGNPLYIVSPGTWVKKYGCCSLNHRALDAILSLINEHAIRYDQVESVQVQVLPPVRDFLRFAEPQNGEQAKFSLQQALGSAVLDGKSDLKAFTDEGSRAPRYVEARRKVRVTTTAEGERFAKWSPPVTIRLKNGKEYVARADALKGSQDLPLTKDELVARHESLVGAVMSPQQVQRFVDLTFGLEKLDSVQELMELATFGAKR